MVATTAATTTLPVPKLVPEMRRLAERHSEAGDWAAARIFGAFANNLDIFANDISKLNADPHTPRGRNPFGVLIRGIWRCR